MSDEGGAVVVRTMSVKLSEDKWVSVGEGPSLVGAWGTEILFAISDVEPGLEDVGFILRLEAPPLPVDTQARLWARASLGGARFARVVVAPLNPTRRNAKPPASERAAMGAITSAAHSERSPSPTNLGASQA